jgi:hypothetical protein
MRDIPREEWKEFLETFSRQHEGWLVTIEVVGAETGAQIEAEEKPLDSITVELKGGGGDSISIAVGITPVERVEHSIMSPTHVRVEQAESGADMTLQVESQDRATTLLR